MGPRYHEKFQQKVMKILTQCTSQCTRVFNLISNTKYLQTVCLMHLESTRVYTLFSVKLNYRLTAFNLACTVKQAK